jgi:ATP-binding cassette subfamily F protein 3
VLLEEENRSMTTLEYLLSRHVERVRLLKELHNVLSSQQEVDVEALESTCQRLRDIESDSAEARALAVLNGLQIEAAYPLRLLSGGWRHRAALASALFLEADILLLDEPTNHLDIHAMVWLEEHLKSVRSTVVAVSHDYDFLDAFTTDIICFEELTLKYFRGNFSAYLSTRQQNLAHHKKMYRAQEIRRRTLQRTIDMLRSRSETSPHGLGAIQSRERQLKHRLGASLGGASWKYSLMGPRPEILAPAEMEPFAFEFISDLSDLPANATGSAETLLIRMQNVSFSFDGQTTVVPQLSIDVTLSSRLAIIGRNGSGKSTFLRLLFGELHPTNGSVTRWEGLRTAFFQQHCVKSFVDDVPPLPWLMSSHPSVTETQARNALGKFGIFGLQAERCPVQCMSDGERARVLFASMMVIQPHLLVLDEPTSHLDAETKAAVAAGLESFEGAVVLASHDRWFVDEVSAVLLCLDPPNVGIFEGSFEDYKAMVMAAARKANSVDSMNTDAEVRASYRERTGRTGQRQAMLPEPKLNLPEAVSRCPVVRCRHCGGDHFSHTCSIKPKAQSPELTEGHTTLPSTGEGPARKASARARLPPTSVRSGDGLGDWKVVISKSARRRIQRGK